jgi:hypothetical protein
LHEEELAKQEREIIESLEREEREKTGPGNADLRDNPLRFQLILFHQQTTVWDPYVQDYLYLLCSDFFSENVNTQNPRQNNHSVAVLMLQQVLSSPRILSV